jgi:hypothetical protein
VASRAGVEQHDGGSYNLRARDLGNFRRRFASYRGASKKRRAHGWEIRVFANFVVLAEDKTEPKKVRRGGREVEMTKGKKGLNDDRVPQRRNLRTKEVRLQDRQVIIVVGGEGGVRRSARGERERGWEKRRADGEGKERQLRESWNLPAFTGWIGLV